MGPPRVTVLPCVFWTCGRLRQNGGGGVSSLCADGSSPPPSAGRSWSWTGELWNCRAAASSWAEANLPAQTFLPEPHRAETNVDTNASEPGPFRKTPFLLGFSKASKNLQPVRRWVEL